MLSVLRLARRLRLQLLLVRLHQHLADDECGNDWCQRLRSGEWRKDLADTPHWSTARLSPFNQTDLDELHQSLTDLHPHLLQRACLSAQVSTDYVANICLAAELCSRALSANEVWWLRYLTNLAVRANNVDSATELDVDEMYDILSEMTASFVMLAVSLNLPHFAAPPPDVRDTLRQIAEREANEQTLEEYDPELLSYHVLLGHIYDVDARTEDRLDEIEKRLDAVLPTIGYRLNKHDEILMGENRKGVSALGAWIVKIMRGTRMLRND